MKKILLGLLALSAVSMASSVTSSPSGAYATDQQQNQSATAKGTFTNRFGINYGTAGKEDSDDTKVLDPSDEFFDTSIGINYKLLYNVTDRFRWGGEVGYSSVDYNDDIKDQGIKVDDNIGLLMLGLTLEYDVYSGENLDVYLNWSLGGAFNETEFKTGSSTDSTLKAAAYAKVGLGLRLNNGLGFEIGRRGEGYVYEEELSNKDTTLMRGLTYFELNYSF